MSDDRWTTALRTLAEPIVSGHDAEIYDIERLGPIVRLSITRVGGIDLDTITAINRALSHEIDEQDPIPGAFTLEVSSPGLERRLRTVEQWAGAIGEQVKVKLSSELDGQRRLEGSVAAIAGEIVTLQLVDGQTIALDLAQIDTAKTHFEWGNTPKPGHGPRPTIPVGKNSESINKDGHDER